MRNHHDYLPAAGHDVLLPAYDLLTRVLGMAPSYDALVAGADLFPGARVLEIGCGTGNVTMRVKHAQPEVQLTGLDPDPRALTRARRKADGISGLRFEQGYAQELPYADRSFDRVLSSMMLHHLDADLRADALAEAYRVLSPGGSMHVLDFVGNHGWTVDGADELLELLRGCGFEATVMGTRRTRLFGPVALLRGMRGS